MTRSPMMKSSFGVEEFDEFEGTTLTRLSAYWLASEDFMPTALADWATASEGNTCRSMKMSMEKTCTVCNRHKTLQSVEEQNTKVINKILKL